VEDDQTARDTALKDAALAQTDPIRIAAHIAGSVDLYNALRQAGADAGQELILAEIIAALLKGHAVAQATATRLASVDRGLLRAVLRKGAGLPATAAAPAVKAYLETIVASPLFLPPIAESATLALLTGGQHPDMPAFSDHAFDDWFADQADGRLLYGLGSYFEKRSVYATPQFADVASPEWRTMHLGVDVFAAAGTPVYAPLAGRVLHLTYNADLLDYGHTLILEHDAGGVLFYTLYGHLGASLPTLLAKGDAVTPGQLIAHLGDWHENGGWAAHIHFQVMTDMLDQNSGNFFGVGHESLSDVWSEICLDPNLILRLPEELFTL
jgi:murein DD-endopeptidase MepM/ murein hydrolase activator NlpD